MYTYLNGILAHKGELPTGGAYFVVDVNGVGYQVHTSNMSLIHAPQTNAPIKVFTSLIVREDLMQLVGFLSREERDMFEILGTASGVGAKVALALMSSLTVPELASAIMGGDFKRLTAAKGVGPKLAQKITIELKDKLSKWRDERLMDSPISSGSEPLAANEAFQEAETVLLSLGYDVNEVYHSLKHIQSTSENATRLTSEEVLQHALKWLATHPTPSA